MSSKRKNNGNLATEPAAKRAKVYRTQSNIVIRITRDARDDKAQTEYEFKGSNAVSFKLQSNIAFDRNETATLELRRILGNNRTGPMAKMRFEVPDPDTDGATTELTHEDETTGSTTTVSLNWKQLSVVSINVTVRTKEELKKQEDEEMIDDLFEKMKSTLDEKEGVYLVFPTLDDLFWKMVATKLDRKLEHDVKSTTQPHTSLFQQLFTSTQIKVVVGTASFSAVAEAEPSEDESDIFSDPDRWTIMMRCGDECARTVVPDVEYNDLWTPEEAVLKYVQDQVASMGRKRNYNATFNGDHDGVMIRVCFKVPVWLFSK